MLKKRGAARASLKLMTLYKYGEYSSVNAFFQRLPQIVQLLNDDSQSWWNLAEKLNVNERWNLWLIQSLVEAGNAYDGNFPTSCLPGIYERLFSGFRGMHSKLDVILNIQAVIDHIRDSLGPVLEEALNNPETTNYSDQELKDYLHQIVLDYEKTFGLNPEDYNDDKGLLYKKFVENVINYKMQERKNPEDDDEPSKEEIRLMINAQVEEENAMRERVRAIRERRERVAVSDIQRLWRGHLARTQVRDMRTQRQDNVPARAPSRLRQAVADASLLHGQAGFRIAPLQPIINLPQILERPGTAPTRFGQLPSLQ